MTNTSWINRKDACKPHLFLLVPHDFSPNGKLEEDMGEEMSRAQPAPVLGLHVYRQGWDYWVPGVSFSPNVDIYSIISICWYPQPHPCRSVERKQSTSSLWVFFPFNSFFHLFITSSLVIFPFQRKYLEGYLRTECVHVLHQMLSTWESAQSYLIKISFLSWYQEVSLK